MSSLFKMKRNSNSDSKSSTSMSSKTGTESDSKTAPSKNSGSKSGQSAAVAPAGASSAAAADASPPLPPSSKQSSSTSKLGKVARSKSFDANFLAEMESFPIDSRLMGSTVTDKTLSISRSGRCKAKGKARARLFSDESPDGSADCPDGDRRGATTLSSPEDRQTVLDAMAMRSGRSAAASAAAAGEVKSDGVTSPKWSVAPNSLDL